MPVDLRKAQGSSWHGLPGSWECRCFPHGSPIFSFEKEKALVLKCIIRKTNFAWRHQRLPGLQAQWASFNYARPFHIQVFHIALITTSTPSQLNQAKGNQAKPYSTFPRGKSFAFVLLKPSQLFFSPLCWCLPDPILSSIPLSQPLRAWKRIFHPTLAKHEPHCLFVSISAAAIKTKQTKQKPKKSNFKNEVGFLPTVLHGGEFKTPEAWSSSGHVTSAVRRRQQWMHDVAQVPFFNYTV